MTIRPAAKGHVLLAWEQGAGLGHVAPLALLAQAYHAAGWQVSVAAADLEPVGQMNWPPAATLWQGPAFTRALAQPQAAEGTGSNAPLAVANMSSVLLNSGWNQGPTLEAMARAWLTLMARIRPTLVLTDYAPAAAWVARSLAIPCVNAGVWSVPVPGNPMPALRWWNPAAPGICRHHDEMLLERVDLVAKSSGLRPWQQAADAWAADLSVLTTVPALDHGLALGQPRQCSGVLASPQLLAEAGSARWPAGAGPRVLVYLPPTSPAVGPVLQALQHCGAVVVAVLPGVTASEHRLWRASRTVVYGGPVNLDPALGQATAVVTAGNHGTTAQALSHGLPVLALPDQLERQCNAMALHRSGAGLTPESPANPAQLECLLRQLLRGHCTAAAQAASHEEPAGHLPSHVAANIAAASEAWRCPP